MHYYDVIRSKYGRMIRAIRNDEIAAGASGAGKTTTLHAITGLLPVESGEIIYIGTNLTSIEPSKSLQWEEL